MSMLGDNNPEIGVMTLLPQPYQLPTGLLLVTRVLLWHSLVLHSLLDKIPNTNGVSMEAPWTDHGQTMEAP